MARKKILIHPGDILRDELTARGLSANQFAIALGVPSGRIVEILNRKRGVSADTALRLSRYLGTSAQVWMNIQAQYDLELAEQELGDKIAARVKPAPKDTGAVAAVIRRESPMRRQRAAG